MSPGPSDARPTPWSADRQPPRPAAGALTTALVVVGFAFVPVARLRDLFGRDFREESVQVPTEIDRRAIAEGEQEAH